jgi:hypothetical protein
MGTVFLGGQAGGTSVVEGGLVSVNTLASGQQVVEQFDNEGLPVEKSLDSLAMGWPFDLVECGCAPRSGSPDVMRTTGLTLDVTVDEPMWNWGGLEPRRVTRAGES